MKSNFFLIIYYFADPKKNSDPWLKIHSMIRTVSFVIRCTTNTYTLESKDANLFSVENF